MYQLLLLLIKVNNLSIVDVKDFVCPKSTACMDVHIEFVRNKSSSHAEFTLLFAEQAHQLVLGVLHFEVFSAAHKRLGTFVAFHGVV